MPTNEFSFLSEEERQQAAEERQQAALDEEQTRRRLWSEKVTQIGAVVLRMLAEFKTAYNISGTVTDQVFSVSYDKATPHKRKGFISIAETRDVNTWGIDTEFDCDKNETESWIYDLRVQAHRERIYFVTVQLSSIDGLTLNWFYSGKNGQPDRSAVEKLKQSLEIHTGLHVGQIIKMSSCYQGLIRPRQ